jgi:hypothetical protein
LRDNWGDGAYHNNENWKRGGGGKRGIVEKDGRREKVLIITGRKRGLL